MLSMIRIVWHRAFLLVIVSFVVSVLWLAEAQAEGFRTWTNSEGRTVRATFSALENGEVKMTLLNGKSAAVPLEKLSEADRKWVKKQMEKVSVPVVQKPKQVPTTRPAIKPKEKVINWEGLTDLGNRIPDLPPIPEPDTKALISVDDWIGGHYFYMRPDGSDAFPHLKITNRIKAFSDGLAWVETKEHKGFINREGKWLIGGDGGVPLPEGVGRFEPFSEGLAQFRKDKSCGFIDTTGKVVVPAGRYFSVQNFSDGLAAVNDSMVYSKQNWSFIDRTGKVVLPGPWPKVLSFSCGVAWVCLDPDYSVDTNGRYQLIDKTGKKIFGDTVFMGNTIEKRFIGGYCLAGGRLYGTDGAVVFEKVDDYFITGVSKDGVHAFASIRGGRGFRCVHLPSKSVYGPVIPSRSDHAFQEGLTPVYVQGQGLNKYVCYDRRGRRVFKDAFFDAPKFENGFAVVRKAFGPETSDIRVVVIDRKGKIIWKGEGQK